MDPKITIVRKLKAIERIEDYLIDLGADMSMMAPRYPKSAESEVLQMDRLERIADTLESLFGKKESNPQADVSESGSVADPTPEEDNSVNELEDSVEEELEEEELEEEEVTHEDDATSALEKKRAARLVIRKKKK